jgi:hypothetical protein
MNPYRGIENACMIVFASICMGYVSWTFVLYKGPMLDVPYLHLLDAIHLFV